VGTWGTLGKENVGRGETEMGGARFEGAANWRELPAEGAG
jgi:hypothetical protein